MHKKGSQDLMKRTIAIIMVLLIVALTIFLVTNIFVTVDYTSGDILPRTVEADSVSCTMLLSENQAPLLKVIPEEPYEYNLPVPASREVDDSYFENCVFIGDSRMLGLVKYNDISPTNYCSVGFSVAAYDTAAFVRIDGENYTVKDALRNNNEYKAVYIATGLNELGWSLGKFKSKYADMIDDIKEISGDRPIYIQLIMPMTAEFESSKRMNPYELKNSNVSLFNEALIELAVEKQIYYIDCSELFVLEDGSLNPEKSFDGAHLTLDAYSEQLDYYKNHVAEFFK